MNHSCPRKVSHSKSSFDKLYAGGETDEYAKQLNAAIEYIEANL